MLQDLFLNPATMAALPSFILSLGLAALLGYGLGWAYVRFGQSATNRRLLARNFVLLTVTTTLVIAIIKSSLALSLGLVGALSIVRFRAAIKEPEELAYLFLAISIGLGLGAGQALLTIVALVVVVALAAWRRAGRPKAEAPNLFVAVSGPRIGGLSCAKVQQVLHEIGAEASLRRFEESAEAMEAAFQVQFGEEAKLEEFARRLRVIDAAVRITCLEDQTISG